MRSPCCPRPARLQRWKPMQARVTGCKSAACAIRSSQPPALSANGSASLPRFPGSRRSKKAERSASGPGPPVRRRTAHPTRASALVSSWTPDRRRAIQSASRSGPIRSPTNQLRSAASIRASLWRQPSGPLRNRSSSPPSRPATRASLAAWSASALRQSSTVAVSRGSALGPGGRLSGSSSIGPGRNHCRFSFTISLRGFHMISARYLRKWRGFLLCDFNFIMDFNRF